MYCVSCKKNTGDKNYTVRKTEKKQINDCIKLSCFRKEKIKVKSQEVH